MIKIGNTVGGRYEILEKIGQGGMSDVYKAKDNKLNRPVAVKVLKQEFSENASFVAKFRIEAQAAAGLMHPNIVNVYDVGEEEKAGLYYIVMELVEGITLKKYIEKKAGLTYKEAVSIAIQVSLGIEAAHKNGIIHRDIKPQNIMISKDGKVKVTDFGIAKAATSNTISSNVMGSVHYTSPEQARGGYSDAKSDIYSLGITLYEMLTGRLPFTGDTTVAIAIKHIQENMPSPRDINPDIPVSVEGIVMKCCQKSPDRRYSNMAELVADLKRSLQTPDEDFVVIGDPIMDGGTRTATAEELADIKRSNTGSVTTELNLDGIRLAEEAEQPSDPRNPKKNGGRVSNEDAPSKMERITTILAIVGGLLICIVLIVLIFTFVGKGKDPENNTKPSTTTQDTGSKVIDDFNTKPSGDSSSTVPAANRKKVVMPNVTGYTAEDATKALTDLGLKAVAKYEESDTVNVGLVISTSVSNGTELYEGDSVTLYISVGAKGVTVPTLVGGTYDKAYSDLTALGFVVRPEKVYSATVTEGNVISTSPEGGTVAQKGCVITVTVSQGPESTQVEVPNMINQSLTAATTLAANNGLVIGNVTYIYSDTVPEGYVCYQSYTASIKVERGTSIDLQVSQGPKPVYDCSISIESPFKEDPSYVSGTDVKIKLSTDDGQTLLETTYQSFPQTANYYGLSASSGTLTLTYEVNGESKTINRKFDFTKR